MKSVEFSRIYQGRVTRAARLSSTGKGKKMNWEESEFADGWESALWAHHALFQDGVNYYLLALIACAGKGCPELFRIEEQVEACWEDFRAKGHTRRGVKHSVSRWLGLDPATATFDEACARILDGSEAQPEVRRLAVQLLLSKATGDSGIQQNGRGYWPRFCNPANRPTYDFSPSARASGEAGAKLQAALQGSMGEEERRNLAEEMTLDWVVKVDPDKPERTGEDAKARLKEAIQFFRDARGTDKLSARVAAWLAEHDSEGSQIDVLERELNQVGAGLRIPVNRKAAQERTFAALLFQHFPSEFTQGLLAVVLGQPKKAAKSKAREAGTVQTEQPDFARFGDDPIRLARGTRGYVFPAFTALPAWNPASPGAPTWKELDIAMFKEALKVLNQFSQQTEKRRQERDQTRRVLDHMLGCSEVWEDPNTEAPPRLLDSDPLVVLLKKLEKDLLPPDVTEEERARPEVRYSFSERALRGLEELIAAWRRIAPPGTAFSADVHERLRAELLRHHETHRESLGSALLFNTLISGLDLDHPSAEFWPLWQDKERPDILWDWAKKQELEGDLEHLSRPIRFTPADAEHSRRLFMASDLGGNSNAVQREGAVDVSLAVQEGGQWREQRARLHYSAPRLARDHLSTDGVWLSPKLAAMLKLDDAPPQKLHDCAVALMPEPANEGRGVPRRFLLNFPVSLDVSKLPGRAEREQSWRGQFVEADDSRLHLHWPGTRVLSKSKVVQKAKPWWETLDGFSCLGVDLGQRTAGAAARVEVSADPAAFAGASVVWPLGQAGDRAWRARLVSQRLLRLPGEDATVWDGRQKQMRTEDHGSTGRRVTEEETRAAQAMLDRLGMGDAFRLLAKPTAASMGKADPDTVRAWPEALRYFPAQNDLLLRAFKRAQGRLARLQGWLYLLREKADLGRGKVLAALREDRSRFVRDALPPESDPDADLKALTRVEAPDWAQIESLLDTKIRALRDLLQAEVTTLANRILPLRDGYWQWQTHPDSTVEKPLHLLVRHRFGPGERAHQPPKVRGQRGLSLPRIEQLAELRRRCQSLNRALQRAIGGPARFGASLAGDDIPDPCPDLEEKLEQLREQRVNQTAHLILAEALGLRLKAPETDRELRRKHDIHGEYKAVRPPVDFIVIENLERYRTSQGRAPGENSRLMQWCHRQITAKLKELCEPLGLPVVEVHAAYSSRFCSRSGVAGFRAWPLTPADRERQPFKHLLQEAAEKGTAASDDAKLACDLFAKLREREIGGEQHPAAFWPKAGGPVFVPMTDREGAKPMQADLNAAINIALRAIAPPEAVRHLHRVRAVMKDGQLLPKMENLREQAAHPGGNPEAFAPPSQGFSKVERHGVNLFPDSGRIAAFDQTTHPAFPETPLATGKALWKGVKDKSAERCRQLAGVASSTHRVASETLPGL